MNHQLKSVAELVTIQDWIHYTESSLNDSQVYCGHGTDNTWDEAVYLVLAALDLPWNTDKSALENTVSEVNVAVIQNYLKQRTEQRMPLPYITGKAYWAGLEFQVDESTLIPRSPVSEFIEYAFEPWIKLPAKPRILDLCAGSGCIGLAIANYFPDADVVASDISKQALEKAKINQQALGIKNIELVQSDLFDNIIGKFDVIVSNPPYVNAFDMTNLPPEYQHEPQSALAAGNDGLDFVKIILKQARHYLKDNGILIVEVGNSAESLVDQFPKLPFYWPEFENEGFGVFLLEKKALDKYI